MDRSKLKDIIRTLEITLDTLKAEVYSDVDSYKSEEEYSSRPLDYCLLYTSPSPRDQLTSRMPSSA